MCEVKFKKVGTMMPVINELLDEGKRVRITVTGMSMYPFLRHNVDSVELMKTNYSNVHRGDIVLIVRDDKQYVLHRIIRKKKKCFYLNGDGQQWCEGPLLPEQIIAKVCNIWRKDHCISCSNKFFKVLSFLWLLVFPFRYIIIETYLFLSKSLKRVRSNSM
jgi:signal peptidase